MLTTPVAPLIVNAAASAPPSEYVTAPPATSVAVAVYTVVPAAAPSVTLPAAPELIAGATSVTVRVTSCVLNAPEGSEAFTLKL